MPVTLNMFGVAAQGDMLVFLFAQRLMRPLAKADALNLAAWIVALADPEFDPGSSDDFLPDGHEGFCETLRAIKDT